MKLSDVTQSRNNNFNLIRIIAAFAVLFTHSFVLATGQNDAEPLVKNIGMSIGNIAVDIFFITSGFLVTASLLTKQNMVDFITARVLRIFPALITMLLITVFGLGAFFTTLSLPAYFSEAQPYKYLLKCATPLFGITHNLPGVFANNPYPDDVNGSLWTLKYETRMYFILALAWALLSIISKNRQPFAEKIIMLSTAISGVWLLVQHLYLSVDSDFSRLFFMFFSGASFYVLKPYILLSKSFFGICMIALLATAFTNQQLFFVVYLMTLAYILFYLAYMPSGFIRKYNDLGDFSYGMYIYAFPVQQSIAALIPHISILSMILLSSLVTISLAILSWYLIEQPALNLKIKHKRSFKT